MHHVCPTCNRTFAEPLPACPDDGAPLLMVADADADPLVGATLDGRFRIDKKLGEGGMGAVYLGVQTSVDREVAIKVIRREAGSDEEAVKRFYREAKVVSKLQQPNIVNLFDFGQTKDGLLYLAMEFVRGRSLTREIGQGPMPVARAAAIAGQVCDALADAHAQGIVHRDLKPDNILLTARTGNPDYVKVLDFGIAKVANQPGGTALTQAGSIMGTPQYMSPEQIDGKGLITHKADLYAMAVIVFEMLAGTPPFQDDTPIKLLIKHLKDEAPLLRQVAPGVRVPEAVEAFLRKNLSKNPDERCGDALGFKAELLAAAGDMTQVPLAGTTLGWEPTIEALVVGTVNIAQPTKLASAAPDTNRTRVSATFAPGPRPKPTPRPPTQKPPTQPPAPRPATLPPRPAPGTEAPTIAGSLHVVAADETAPPLAKKPFPIAIVAAAAGVIAAGIAAWALLSRAPEVPRPAPEVAAPVAVVPVPPPVAAVPVPEPPAAPVVAPGPPATAPAIAPAPAVAPSPPAPGPAAVAAQPGPSPAPAVPKKKPAQAPRKKKNLGLE